MPVGALAFAVELLSSLPGLISAGVQVVDLIQNGQAKLKLFDAEKRDPTPAEWDELNASIAAKRKELHAS